MTRWLVLGAGGMLGREVVDALHHSGREHVGLRRGDCDVTHQGDVFHAVRGYDIVINCAAWTDVDAAEKERDRADLVNGYGAAHVADACRNHGAKLLHVSTDYVFSGTYGVPLAEDSPTDPVNAYGSSKALGEEWVRDILSEAGYVVRTAWLYGQHGPNFVDTMARLAQGPDPVRVVDDQWGQPTWTRALAYRLVTLGERALSRADPAPAGIYHGVSRGHTTWYGLARAVFDRLGHDPDRVVPVSSDEYERPAVRPHWSVLSSDHWGTAGLSPDMGHWKTMLGGAMATTWFTGRE